jgi:1-deoxy-D-xylulose-5-phosphate reductoisomerase
MEYISVLGSTGSIGVQTLEVLKEVEGDDYQINFLTVHSNVEKLAEQVLEYNPRGVAIADENAFKRFKEISDFKGKILCGEEGVIQAASDKRNYVIMSALVGFSGVKPTLAAINNGIQIALANKETLVSAGQIITDAAEKHEVSILAVDSEHSAILQCIVGETHDEIEKIILTASGGPFLKSTREELETVTRAQALKHPNWTMGSKITIDSATLMNKGFEVIEAKWLFDLEPEQIDVVVHPQSIIHSMVQFVDGSVKAQLGLPDMKLPISYALNFPHRAELPYKRLDITEVGTMTFLKPDLERFPCLQLAFDALKAGGTATAVVNAANEIAVAAFLKEQIKFMDIPRLIEFALNKMHFIKNPSLDELVHLDNETRNLVTSYIQENRF